MSYRNNPFLKKANQTIEWTDELIIEFIRCKDDIFYFIENYYKIVTEDGLIPMVLRDYQKEMIISMENNRYTIAVMARQSGKALDLNTTILTPQGFKRFGDVHTGDEIYSIDGKKTKIKFETEIMYNHNCFNVEFDNGEVITADEDHVWTVEILQKHGRLPKKLDITTKKLKELLEKQQKKGQSVRIKIADPIDYPEQKVSIDPYVLGLWLGDGNRNNGYLTAHKDDLNFYKNFFEITLAYIDKRNPNTHQANIKGLCKELNHINLIKNKHIPEKYLFNSVENRLALIQGLMDSDGSVTDSGSFEFYQKNKQIIDQFRFLLSSLGIKSRLRSKKIKDEIYYTVSFCHRKFDFFRLPRKLETVKLRNKGDAIKNYYFYIKKITEVESVPVKCIQVENPSHLFLIGNTLIPTHNTECYRAFCLHQIIFREYLTIGIAANIESTANEILGKLQTSYQNLPLWLQHGIVEFNKGSFVLDNGSRIITSATTANAFRGFTLQVLIVDEAAHVETWSEFYRAIKPAISAGKKTKFIMASTPNGLNHFYEFWEGCHLQKNTNGYYGLFVSWERVPGRDEEWKKTELASINNDLEFFAAEYCCEFIGSSGTLVAGWRLKQIIQDVKEPLMKTENDDLKFYEYPVKPQKELKMVESKKRFPEEETTLIEKEIETPGHSYVILCDCARGKNLDYHAFSVIDVTQLPYNQVCTYRNNGISPAEYSDIIYQVAKFYNDAGVLVEINDLGEQVSSLLIDQHEYENVFCTINSGKKGKQVVMGVISAKVDKGIRTTSVVKNTGCLMLKLLVEQGKLIINDFETVNELKTFSKNKNTYKAETGKNDDLVMGLVLFAWFSDQQHFREITNINTIGALRERSPEEIFSQLSPLGFHNDMLISTKKDHNTLPFVMDDTEINAFRLSETAQAEINLWKGMLNF